ncbi:MAG TPA: hypothetical protein VJH03_19665 [Blastocatellia bacterium]|nr:hypothetical protein [Blastocatellia bacterium]
MKTFTLTLSITFFLVISGCNRSNQSPASGPNAGAAALPTSNSNARSPAVDQPSPAASAPDTAPSASTSAPPTPVGNYRMSEIHEGGVVTMVRPENAVDLLFIADGTYARSSRDNGKITHKDNGQFRIEGGDKLVLVIQVSRGRIQIPPVEKAHTFSLSPDGEELRLTTGAKLALFRRIQAPSKK